MLSKWDKLFINDLSYKIVAFFIALILWLTILGRRDFPVAKEMEPDFITHHQHMVTPSVEKIKAKFIGSRQALQKLSKNIEHQYVYFDLSKYSPGKVELRITQKNFDLPLGARLVSVEPERFYVIIRPKGQD